MPKATEFEKILVTGATGRLGANLIKALAGQGVKVRAFVLPGDSAVEQLKPFDPEVITGDLSNEQHVAQAVHGVDGIVHCAAVMGEPKGMTHYRFFDINVRGSLNVFEAAAHSETEVRKLVYISSTAAYSVTTSGPVIKEDDTLRPDAFYGMTKCVNEEMARVFRLQHDLP